MSNVVVTINERTYDLTCNDGQEQHLRGLAADIARRVDELTKTVGQPGEGRLLLMVALLLADELADANAEIDRLQREHGRAPAIDEEAVAASLERLAKHVQDIAARLEAA
jgi:cell division protein ZapA